MGTYIPYENWCQVPCPQQVTARNQPDSGPNFGLAVAGSIPARAGEPRDDRDCRGGQRVYPRPCGGAETDEINALPASGLSPPVRGSPSRSGSSSPIPRSIPARAGEPVARLRVGVVAAVYPRPCGGARLSRIRIDNENGLSPPVRGSPQRCRPS